ncbi:hypothetical protein DPX16_21681, partial [Anabarilius grahami]
ILTLKPVNNSSEVIQRCLNPNSVQGKNLQTCWKRYQHFYYVTLFLICNNKLITDNISHKSTRTKCILNMKYY